MLSLKKKKPQNKAQVELNIGYCLTEEAESMHWNDKICLSFL